MPTLQTRTMETYYEMTKGDGAPFLLVNGLGSNINTWDLELREAIAHRRGCVVFDNRGVGRSAVPPGPYSIEQFADDALALLDALELERVHLMGASMGGLIAQQIAISAPERLASLTLCCTFPGFSYLVSPPQEVLQILTESGHMEPEAGTRHVWTICFLPEFLERETAWLDAKLACELQYPCRPDVYDWHLEAATSWDGAAQLSKVPVPTLIQTGEDDVLVPPENSETLLGMLPHATLKTYPNAGHAFLTEQRDAAATDMLAHAAAHETVGV